MVRGLITATAAAVVLGLVAPATARVSDPAFDATLSATLARSWTWQSDHPCGTASGEGRRTIRVRTTSPVRIGATGGTLRIVGTLRLEGTETTPSGSPMEGSCDEVEATCTPRSTPISGTVRVTIRGDVVRLSTLRYRTRGPVGCAQEHPDVRAALRDRPKLEDVPVRDRNGRLRNGRVKRVTVTGRADPFATLSGTVRGEVHADVAWTLVLVRR